MAIGVTFPENEDVVTFWWKIERLVRVECKVDIYKKELGNYAGYWLRKVYWKDLHYWGMKISRDAVTHMCDNNAHSRIIRNETKISPIKQAGQTTSEHRQKKCLLRSQTLTMLWLTPDGCTRFQPIFLEIRKEKKIKGKYYHIATPYVSVLWMFTRPKILVGQQHQFLALFEQWMSEGFLS